MQTRITNYIYKNDLDKACFQHDMVYGKYKSLAKGTDQIEFKVIKLLKLLVIQNMVDIKDD